MGHNATHDPLHEVSERLHEAHVDEQIARALDATRSAAERAAVVAQHAREHASPHVRHATQAAMESLSKTAAHASELLADSAHHVSAPTSLTPLLAVDTHERRRHRLRTIVVTGLVIGGIVAFFRSSLPSRLGAVIFGRDDSDPETETITLPIDIDEIADHGDPLHDQHEHHRHNRHHEHDAFDPVSVEHTGDA